MLCQKKKDHLRTKEEKKRGKNGFFIQYKKKYSLSMNSVPLSSLTVPEYSRNECWQGEEKILIKSKFCIDSVLYIRQKVK